MTLWPRVASAPGFFLFMERVTFLVDGFNLYHAINDIPNYQQYKWLDLRKLAEAFVRNDQSIESIFYFTALTPWSANKRAKHQIYIDALESKGVNIVYGEFRQVTKNCTLCFRNYPTYEEKKTDVNIAIHLFKLAFKNKYDKLILITGDSDIIPSIQAVKSTFPTKVIGVLIPIGRKAEDLKLNCDFHMKLRKNHLDTCMLDNEIILANGRKITRPPSWT